MPTALTLDGRRLRRSEGRVTKVLDADVENQLKLIKADAIAAGRFTEKHGVPFWEVRAVKTKTP